MANIQLFARPSTYSGTSSYAGFVQLDLMEAEPVKLSISVQDFEDPTKVPSSYSKTFKVPHSSVNAPFFKAAFNVNSVSYDISKKAEAYVLDNGFLIASGNIRLTSIIVDNDMRSVEYEVSFFGETSDLGSEIGGGFLNEVDLGINFELTYDNVTSSWVNGLYDGDIVYGLVEWGYLYNQNNQPLNNTLSNGFEILANDQGSFTNEDYPLYLEQLKPQIRVKALFDKILEDAGFTYDKVDENGNPSFLETSIFKNLYLISDSVAKNYSTLSPVFKATMPNDVNDVISPYRIRLYPTTEVYDYSSLYDNSASACYYTAPATDMYTFNLYYYAIVQHGPDGTFPMYPVGTTVRFFVALVDPDNPNYVYAEHHYDYVVGEGVVKFEINAKYDSEPGNLGPVYAYLQQGDKVAMYLHIANVGDFIEDHPMSVLTSTTFMCVNAPTYTVINSFLPTNVKKVDFIKSIITKFKLVFVPSKTINNRFSILPWIDWVQKGNNLDWTNKLDGSNSITIKPLFDKQKKKLTFKDKEDSDYLNDNYQKSNTDLVFGQLILDSSIDLITGEETITTEFTPSQLGSIGYKDGDTDSPYFLIPHVAKDSGASEGADAGKREPINPKMRLVYYNGLVDAPIHWYLATDYAGLSPEEQTTYPLMSNYSSWPVTQNSLDLNWKNTKPAWEINTNDQNPQVPWETSNTCFTKYWKTWYDMAYDPYSRIVEATFVLSYKDILELNFNDKIFVKDAWYMVNEIKDYVVGETSACKVTLVKIGNLSDINLIAPVVYNDQELSYGTTACNAYCCAQEPNCSTLNTYYTDDATFADSTKIFLDSYGGIPAPYGYYSDGTDTCQVGANGYVTAWSITSGCECMITSPSVFSCHYASSPCYALVESSLTAVYGTEATFLDNRYLYYDDDFTLPVDDGYYVENGDDPQTALEVGRDGTVLNRVGLTTCLGVTYYPFVVKFSTTSCGSCCSTNYSTVYSDNPVWGSSTVLYSDNAGENVVPDGFYSVNGSIAEVISSVIDSFSSCSLCTPCPEGTVSFTVSIIQSLDTYRTTATIYTSVDQVNWELAGSLSVNSTDPSMTPTVQEFLLYDRKYCYVAITSDEPESTMYLTYSEDEQVVISDDSTTPASYILDVPSQLSEAVSYNLDVLVDGGSAETITYTGFSLNYDANLSNPCRPFCGSGMTPATYYGNASTLLTSTYLFDDEGTTASDPGIYSDGVSIAKVGQQGAIEEFLSTSSCRCDQS